MNLLETAEFALEALEEAQECLSNATGHLSNLPGIMLGDYNLDTDLALVEDQLNLIISKVNRLTAQLESEPDNPLNEGL